MYRKRWIILNNTPETHKAITISIITTLEQKTETNNQFLTVFSLYTFGYTQNTCIFTNTNSKIENFNEITSESKQMRREQKTVFSSWVLCSCFSCFFYCYIRLTTTLLFNGYCHLSNSLCFVPNEKEFRVDCKKSTVISTKQFVP